MKKIKENDVFTWRYTQKHIESLEYKNDLYHCKERLAVAKNVNGTFMFFDTFWGIGRTDNYTFIEAEIDKKYEVEFYCNLDEIDKQPNHSDVKKYYDDKDVFTLHDQHACASSCIYHYLKKGAVKSKDKMIQITKRKIQEIEDKIEYSKSDLIRANKTLDEIVSGADINNIYI